MSNNTSISYRAVRKTETSIQALVNESDQGSEKGVQGDGEDDGPVDGAFDEAKGEGPSAESINRCVGRTPDESIALPSRFMATASRKRKSVFSAVMSRRFHSVAVAVVHASH